MSTRPGQPLSEVRTSLRGQALLEQPLLNQGTAFTIQERRDLGLLGLLPPEVETIEEQATRCYEAFSQQPTDLEKHVYLRNLQDTNETLFYRVALEHIEEILPIIYTPTVGEACQKFSHIYRRPRGLFIAYPHKDDMDEILSNCALKDVEVIVVTDAERILGLGDQGAGGMGIPIGKLSLYTAIGGIAPDTTLPITLDVGTNNQDRLADPNYIGWRHERVRGPEYDAFIETFVEAIMRRFPDVLLQWEDFASRNAASILGRYRDRLLTFNDDIQGTAAVATGTVLAAVAAIKQDLRDQRIVMLGAGSAGIGISNQLVATMMREGLSEGEARNRFYLIDSHGLIHQGRADLAPYKIPFQRASEEVADWKRQTDNEISFEDTVANVRPTVLIGATGQQGAFTEQIVRTMASHVERPIIFPLSNPTSRCEAIPRDIVHWTDGRAIIATGSPFEPVPYEGREIPVDQCNNSYIFPAMGLGVRASGATRVTDEMFMAAAVALKEQSPAIRDVGGPLLPRLQDVRTCAREIAIAVGHEAQQQGLAEKTSDKELKTAVDTLIWKPEYLSIIAGDE